MTSDRAENGATERVAVDSVRDRAFGVDATRIVMAFLVVVLHTASGGHGADFTWLGMVCRAAVPFFFITSGYFLKIPDRVRPAVVIRPLVRLIPIYVFWMLVYYVVAYVTKVQPLLLGPKYLLSGGTAFHLWFLPALGVAMVAVPLGIRWTGIYVTGIVCAVLALTAIAFGAYHDVLHLPGTEQRGGLLVAPAFVFIGHLLSRRRALPSRAAATGIAALGFALLAVEEMWISQRLGVPLADHDFAIGTFLFGTGVFLVARAWPGDAVARRLAPLGLYALGVYASHVLFLWGFGTVLAAKTIGLVFVKAGLSFACATLLTMILYRIPLLRPVVR